LSSGARFLPRRANASHTYNQTSAKQLEEIAALELEAMP
jgi:hypothetical protein